MNKYFWIAFLSLCFFCNQSIYAENLELVSPNGLLKVEVNTEGNVNYEISHNGTSFILPSEISMNFDNGIIAGVNGTVKEIKRNSVDEIIDVVIGKNATLQDKYNELTIVYNQKYSIIFRAYDEGIAYRFKTEFEQENVIVNSEDAEFVFSGDPQVYFPDATETNMFNWERSYIIHNSISNIGIERFAVAPVLFNYRGTPYKVVVLEAGLLDYPGLHLQRKESNSVKGLWAKYPDQVEYPDDPTKTHFPITRFDYLARTVGKRTYPWRVVVVSNDDKSLLNNEIVYKLAEPLKLTDVSWIKPGKSAWEWGHKAILEGVPFPSGGGTSRLSLDLYKYYVDFAARNNLEYMTLDSGWKVDYLRQLCAYAKARGVKIIVWTWASYTIDVPNWMSNRKNDGVAGFKIDFVNRDDQIATNWLETLAKRAADLETVINFHGCAVPTGLNRAYPNILTFEAVRGLECNYWDRTANPDYYLRVPFIRMLSGSLDITPGSLQNVTRTQFGPFDSGNTVPGVNPSAMGTRCYQLAMYVIYDQYLGYLVDSPTEYEKFPDIMQFFKKVPAVWDKTIPLAAEFEKYAIVARQSGDDWYVGGMNSNGRGDYKVDFSFLPEGIDYDVTIYRDSSSSSSYPKRYVYEKKIVSKNSVLPIFMATDGGFVMMLTPCESSGIRDTKKTTASGLYIDSDNTLNVYSKDVIRNVSIYDITGKLIQSEIFGNLSDSRKINISNLKKGIYVLEIDTGTYKDILKFINY